LIPYYALFAGTTGVVARCISHVEVIGRENFPREGPVILTPNHQTIADPPILGAFLPRKIHYMVKIEAWNAPFFGWLARGFEAFPVRRGEVDLQAYRRALKLLADRKVVGIFPEGHRSMDGRLLPGQPGAILLAQRSGSPLLPVAMTGVTEVLSVPGFALRRTIRIVVGQPYHPAATGRGQTAELTDELMARIAQLLPPQYSLPAPPR
jgi:1-acyl-sn-glycerol-3-phosphate acyltransferase